ncbi:hypothetical protein [Yinghuangia sp. YIM S09857]|uniref:hypothetical protein n=1 Tax=Yinghuangia sp. YIM S09857 TaxID=3436929 RepID=UPI003F5349E1
MAELIAAWIREVQAEKTAAQVQLAQLTDRRMDGDEIRALVESLGGLLGILKKGDPVAKHEVYELLGLHLHYDDKTRTVMVEG